MRQSAYKIRNENVSSVNQRIVIAKNNNNRHGSVQLVEFFYQFFKRKIATEIGIFVSVGNVLIWF